MSVHDLVASGASPRPPTGRPPTSTLRMTWPDSAVVDRPAAPAGREATTGTSHRCHTQRLHVNPLGSSRRAPNGGVPAPGSRSPASSCRTGARQPGPGGQAPGRRGPPVVRPSAAAAPPSTRTEAPPAGRRPGQVQYRRAAVLAWPRGDGPTAVPAGGLGRGIRPPASPWSRRPAAGPPRSEGPREGEAGRTPMPHGVAVRRRGEGTGGGGAGRGACGVRGRGRRAVPGLRRDRGRGRGARGRGAGGNPPPAIRRRAAGPSSVPRGAWRLGAQRRRASVALQGEGERAGRAGAAGPAGWVGGGGQGEGR